jgi:hypothetical protein
MECLLLMIWGCAQDGGTASLTMDQEKQALAQLVEDYHQMDAEDFVAGIPCRFRYREVCTYMTEASVQARLLESFGECYSRTLCGTSC